MKVKYYVVFTYMCLMVNYSNSMEPINLKGEAEFTGVIVDSASQEEGHVVRQSYLKRAESAAKIEPQSLHEVKNLVRERSGHMPTLYRSTSMVSSPNKLSRSGGRPATPKKSTPRQVKEFLFSDRSAVEMKNSRGEDKVIPRTVSDVQKFVKARSVRSEPAPKFQRHSRPTFTQEQLDQVYHQQQRQSKRLYTEDEVRDLIKAQELLKKRKSLAVYTEEEVAAILQKYSNDVQPLTSSRFCNYGHEYNIPLNQLPQYAQLLDDIVISPRLLAEFVYKKHGTDKQPKDYEINRYEKMSKHDPGRYEKLVFGMMKALLDEDDKGNDEQNQNLPREFVETHVRLLQDEVGSKTDDIFQYRVAVVVKFLALVGTTAWALYLQISESVATPGPCTNTTG